MKRQDYKDTGKEKSDDIVGDCVKSVDSTELPESNNQLHTCSLYKKFLRASYN